MCNINDTNARFHAVLSAYLSIVAGLCEFVMSSMAGSEEISMSLYGITLMATLDVTGSVLVLMRWQGSSEVQGLVEYIKELKYSMIIGVLMVLLGLFLIVDSVMKFINEDKPTENDELGPIVAIFGFVASMILAIYKFVVGKVLDSAVVTADAISSLCSGFASLAALIVVYIDKFIWWDDSITGLLVALYTLYNGVSTFRKSYVGFRRLNAEADLTNIKRFVVNNFDSQPYNKSSNEGSHFSAQIWNSFSSISRTDYSRIPIADNEFDNNNDETVTFVA